jgi:hypothetical protein
VSLPSNVEPLHRAQGIAAPLCGFEIEHARQVGGARQAWAMSQGLRDKFEADPFKRWGYHVHGAAAELVVARYLGLYWAGSVGDLDAADVGPVQVRAQPEDDGKLIIRPRDRPHAEDPFVLVTGKMPDLMIRGWIVARAGVRRVGRHSDPGNRGAPCWCVPQAFLRPMPELLDLIRRDAGGAWWFAG